MRKCKKVLISSTNSAYVGRPYQVPEGNATWNFVVLMTCISGGRCAEAPTVTEKKGQALLAIQKQASTLLAPNPDHKFAALPVSFSAQGLGTQRTS